MQAIARSCPGVGVFMRFLLVSGMLCLAVSACQYEGSFEQTRCASSSECAGEALCVDGYCELPSPILDQDVQSPPADVEDDGTTPPADVEDDGTTPPADVEEDIEPTPDVVVEPEIDSIQVNGPNELFVGGQSQLSAELSDADGQPITGVQVSWGSSDESVAEVDENGFLTARAPGDVLISASARSAVGTKLIRVLETPAHTVVLKCVKAAVEVSCDNIAVQVGETITVEASVLDENSNPLDNRPVVWASTAPEKALTYRAAGNSDSSKRVIRAIAPGNATIEARVGGALAEVSLDISPAAPGAPHSLVVYPDTLQLPVGATYAPTVNVYDNDGALLSNASVVWTTDPDPSQTASVDGNGQISAQAPGNIRVIAKVPGTNLEASVALKVIPAAAISPTGAELEVGQTVQLQVLNDRLEPVSGASWSSSNGAIAAVNSSGLVTAQKPSGATPVTITATVSGTAYTAAIVVKAQSAGRVVIEPAYQAIKVGETSTDFSAMVFAKDGSVLGSAAVAWSLANGSAIASIDPGTGEVTGQQRGAAAVKATVGSGSDAVVGYAALEVQAPIAYPQDLVARANSTLGIQLNAQNSSGQLNTDLTYELVDNGAPAGTSMATEHGMITLTDPTTGAASYDPDDNYAGMDSFHFIARDLDGTESAPVKVTIAVRPVAQISFAGVDSSAGLVITLSGQDSVGYDACQWEMLAHPGAPGANPLTPDPSDCTAELAADDSGTYTVRLTVTNNQASLSDSTETTLNMP